MCNCYSYNGDSSADGKIPSRILKYPSGDTFCVDECIADVVQGLWDNGVETLGSCCGHNGRYGRPNIILQNNCPESDIEKAKKIISDMDSRNFDLMCWQLVTL